MSRFLLGLSGGLYSFDTTTDDHEPKPVLRGMQPLALAIDPAVPARVYCATYNRGLWRSEDRGETWYPVGTPQSYFEPPIAGGIDTQKTTFVSIAPHADEHGHHPVWVGTELSRLYKSSDCGQTFELVTTFEHCQSRSSWAFPPRPKTHHVRWIAHGPNQEVYVSIEFGAFLRSLDGGKTFEDRREGSPRDTHTLRVHPAAPGRLYAATGDGLLHAGHSWAESYDRGATWQYASAGLEVRPYLYNMAVNESDPDDILVAASLSPQAAHSTGGTSIYRSFQRGWLEDAAGFPSETSLIPVLAADTAQAGQWYALSNLGLFKQKSRTKAWHLLTTLPDWQQMHPQCFAQLK